MTTHLVERRQLDVSAIICAYTMERWSLLCAAVQSIVDQAAAPRELIICVDHNRDLFERCRSQWATTDPERNGFEVIVVENKYGGRLGSARTTAAQLATSTFLAFLDDDARAEPTWLEHMLAAFADPSVIAVGGAPLPTFSTARPRWFPPEYDWVFGCAYVGLPTTTAPVRHVIGAAMSVRREDLLSIGYFHSDDHDDMDMCHRLIAHSPGSQIIFEPKAVVRHFVHENRLTWSYFWRRCFYVNRGKVGAFRQMGDARNLKAEAAFARRALTRGMPRAVRQAVGGDPDALLRLGCSLAGLALAGAGYAVGTLEWVLTARLRALRARWA